MKIVSIVGARPQFIKMGVLSQAIRKRFDEVVLHTGQHYDFEMSDIFFERLGLPKPDHHLGVGSGLHGEQTAQMLSGIEKVLIDEAPDMVVIFGDTNSTLAGALAAAKLRIPLAHVEAGLRSYTKMPEEINRRVADHISDLLFAPTEVAVENLERESVLGDIHRTGDVLVEAVARVRASSNDGALLGNLGVEAGKFWLVTLHRADLTDDPRVLETVLRRLDRIPGPALFPVHPRTRAVLERTGLMSAVPAHVRMANAVGFEEMLSLEDHAIGIVTDSGGVQREAFMLGTPCFTVRTETEWPETLVDGWNRIVGQDAAGLEAALAAPRPTGDRPPAFGTGHATDEMAGLMEAWLVRHRETAAAAR